jgi:cytochrome b subunit of formate dehydrogenase
MLYILLAIIAGVVFEIVLYKIQENSDSFWAVVLVAVFGVALGVSISAYVFAGFNWFAAEHKANIINREYGTNYTAQEVFWAEGVIETIRQIDRQRYELNGNLLNSQKE